MKRLLLFIAFFLLFDNMDGQSLTIKDFLSVSSLSYQKFENYIAKKNFILAGRDWQNDTIVSTYRLKIKKLANDSIPETKIVETYRFGKNFSFAFQTTSEVDYDDARKELKEEEFFCSNESDPASFYLYQRKNILVEVNAKMEPGDTLYSFHFYYKELPPLASIRYADDLLQFTSHEYLVSVFGEKNVKKDFYYFSEKEVTKCSVLFPYTKRQAVFIWGDEANRRHLSSILIGGNMPTESSKKYDNVIAENSWVSKDGIYAGMSLNNLIRLNGSDFEFYGKNSEFPLMVVPDNMGSVNFKKNVVVLGYLSVTNSQLLNKDIVTTDDVLKENPGMFVFMFMLSPAKKEE